jgi:hypothetical protein
MKNIKQIREESFISEKDDSETKKLGTLMRSGLFDIKKLPILKRALEKDPSRLSPAERKALLELLDVLMDQVLNSQQVFMKVKQNVMQKDMHEAKEEYLSKIDSRDNPKYPSDTKIPAVMTMRRKAIRNYPDNQKVALYYIQAIDKYITIPWSENEIGIPMVREAVNDKDELHKRYINSIKATLSDDESPEGEAKKARYAQHATEILKRIKQKHGEKAAAETRGAGIGVGKQIGKQKETVQKWENTRGLKNPGTGWESIGHLIGQAIASPVAAIARKRASSKLTQMTTLSPTGTIKENSEIRNRFEKNLNQIKEEDSTLKSLIPGYDAYQSYKKGNYLGAAGNLALDAATIGAGALTGGLGAAAIRGGVSGFKALRYGKAGLKGAAAAAKKGATRSLGWKLAKKIGGGLRKVGAGTAGLAAGLAAGGSGGSGSAAAGRSSLGPSRARQIEFSGNRLAGGKTVTAGDSGRFSVTSQGGFSSPAQEIDYRRRLMQTQENTDTLSQLKNNNTTIMINEEPVFINKNTAKQILKVYRTLNEENRIKFESMLNENTKSFKQAVNFALRHK